MRVRLSNVKRCCFLLMPVDLLHALHPAHGLHDLLEVWQVVDLDKHVSEDRTIPRVDVGGLDVGARRAHRLHEVGVEAAAVVPGDIEPHHEGLATGLMPVDLHPAIIGGEREQVGAVGAMDGNPRPCVT